MAPMISMKKITEVFQVPGLFGTESLFAAFVDYVNFSIENFKLAIELNFADGGFSPQVRYEVTNISFI